MITSGWHPRPRLRHRQHDGAAAQSQHSGPHRPIGRGQVFVRAGLIPALKRSGEPWEVFAVRPGRQPLARLAEILARTREPPGPAPDAVLRRDSRDELIDTLRAQPGYLGAHLRARCRVRHSRILLFVDQFEELYTLGTSVDTSAGFVRHLEGVADDVSSPLRIVISVRSDFLDRLADDRDINVRSHRGLVFLPPITREGLREALIRPMAATDYAFENQSMVERMLDVLETMRSPLPLLQFTAAKLWEARDDERQLLTRRATRISAGSRARCPPTPMPSWRVSRCVSEPWPGRHSCTWSRRSRRAPP